MSGDAELSPMAIALTGIASGLDTRLDRLRS